MKNASHYTGPWQREKNRTGPLHLSSSATPPCVSTLMKTNVLLSLESYNPKLSFPRRHHLENTGSSPSLKQVRKTCIKKWGGRRAENLYPNKHPSRCVQQSPGPSVQLQGPSLGVLSPILFPSLSRGLSESSEVLITRPGHCRWLIAFWIDNGPGVRRKAREVGIEINKLIPSHPYTRKLGNPLVIPYLFTLHYYIFGGNTGPVKVRSA